MNQPTPNEPLLPADATFEQAYDELSEIVIQLESGELSLEQSLVMFERGQALTQWCNTQLDSAELRITQIKNSNG